MLILIPVCIHAASKIAVRLTNYKIGPTATQGTHIPQAISCNLLCACLYHMVAMHLKGRHTQQAAALMRCLRHHAVPPGSAVVHGSVCSERYFLLAHLQVLVHGNNNKANESMLLKYGTDYADVCVSPAAVSVLQSPSELL